MPDYFSDRDIITILWPQERKKLNYFTRFSKNSKNILFLSAHSYTHPILCLALASTLHSQQIISHPFTEDSPHCNCRSMSICCPQSTFLQCCFSHSSGTIFNATFVHAQDHSTYTNELIPHFSKECFHKQYC